MSLIRRLLAATCTWAVLTGSAIAADVGHTIGNPSAARSLDVYLSLSCTHCRDFFWNALPKLRKSRVRGGGLRITIWHFPRIDADVAAALITECLPAHRFEEAMDAFFTDQARWARDEPPWPGIKRTASRLGVGDAAFDRCLGDQATINDVLATRRQLMESHPIEAAPIFVSGNTVRQGATSLRTLERLVDE